MGENKPIEDIKNVDNICMDNTVDSICMDNNVDNNVDNICMDNNVDNICMDNNVDNICTDNKDLSVKEDPCVIPEVKKEAKESKVEFDYWDCYLCTDCSPVKMLGGADGLVNHCRE